MGLQNKPFLVRHNTIIICSFKPELDMSEENPLSLSLVKRCVICNGETCIDEEIVRCSSGCAFALIDTAELTSYARNGSMKYCYQCGSEMVRGEDFIVCDNCSDSEQFCTSDIISVKDVKHCVLCSSKLKPAGTKLFCSNGKQKCKFRLAAEDDQTVTENLQECAKKGKVKYCYGCGADTIDASDYTTCSKEDCTSVKLPASDNDAMPTQEQSDAHAKQSDAHAKDVTKEYSTSGKLLTQAQSKEGRTLKNATSGSEKVNSKKGMFIISRNGPYIRGHPVVFFPH